MGYDTEYMGTLEFNKELTASQLAILNEILGLDFRDLGGACQNELSPNETDLTYIDLEIGRASCRERV